MKKEALRDVQFTSDWHLSPDTPRLTRAFTYWLESASEHSLLYILGDLFDFWVGDDQLQTEYYANIALALKNCRCPVFIMRGNRDFLLGEAFEKAAQVTFLPDPFLLSLNEQRLLLSHGDQYCTDDLAYMQFFKKTRNPLWKKEILSKPFSERMALAKSLREQSESAQKGEYSDLSSCAIQNLLNAIPCDYFIHGHTHQKGIHLHGKTKRYVLPNWEENAAKTLPEILIYLIFSETYEGYTEEDIPEEGKEHLNFFRFFDPALF